MQTRTAAISTALMILCFGQRLSGGETASEPVVSSRIEKRVVKTFDFNERPLGNFEEQPMNWLPMVGAGFPRFLEAGFDLKAGHDGAPSFFFAARAGSVGAFYLSKDIPVHPDSAYRISAWVRTRQVTHARARLSAYYLDHALRKIEGSETWSRAIAESRDWTRVEIDLAGGFDRAQWIGLAFRLEQPSRRAGTGEADPIAAGIVHRDAGAQAWLDDITVMRLPIVSMRLNAVNGAFVGDEPTTIDIAMRDLDGTGLRVDLEVLDAESRVLFARRLNAADLVGGTGARVTLDPLPAGRYAARVTTRAGETLVSTHERAFLRLCAALPTAGRGPRGIGVVADDAIFDHGDLNVGLMSLLSPDAVKLPLWRANQDDDDIVKGNRQTDAVVDELLKRGMRVVGVLADLPPSLAAQFEAPDRRLMTVLAGPPAAWRPYLALVLMRHGHRIRAWQVGGDGPADLRDEAVREQAMRNVSAEVSALIGRPRVAAPAAVWSDAPPPAAADAVALSVPAHLAVDGLAGVLSVPPGSSSAARWATLEPRDPARYDRQWRLIDFARRLLACRTAGIETVFVRQPWRIENAPDGPAVRHDEEFIILRTLNQALGGLRYDRDLWIGEGVIARQFVDESGESGAVVLYSDGQGPSTIAVSADLGTAVTVIDAWGNTHTPTTSRGETLFEVDAMPVIVRPVDAWRGRLLDSFRIEPASFNVAVDDHVRQVTITNTRRSRLRGDLKLITPPGWRVMPAVMGLNLAPGEAFSQTVAFRLPTNQPAGRFALTARLRALDDDFEGVTLRTPIEVNAPGLDVNAAAYVDGDHVRVIHRITNRTDDALRLKAYMVSPDRTRDVRLIRNLAPAQTTVREYRIDDVAAVAGKHIRLTVEQMDGPLRHNAVIRLE